MNEAALLPVPRMTFGSLFAGIGGMDLGLERAGMTCKWQVEIDPYARRVLAKHWPDVRRWDDVRTFPRDPWDEWRVDLICGGFPCQDTSRIGTRKGIDGAKSGTVHDMLRIVRQLRPRYVVVENSPGFLDAGRGFGFVVGSLARLGFDSEWASIPASALGAPHLRKRVFLVAHAVRDGLERPEQGGPEARPVERSDRDVAGLGAVRVLRGLHLHDSRGTCSRLQVRGGVGLVHEPIHGSQAWATESPVCRVASRVPHRMDRLRGLGNAVVPQVAEFIGRRILEAADLREHP
jgi:DNA (cytosine-5)-methyltransferase 1